MLLWAFLRTPSRGPVRVSLNEASQDFYKFAEDLAGKVPSATGISCSERGVCNKALAPKGSEQAFLLPAFFAQTSHQPPLKNSTKELETMLLEYVKGGDTIFSYQLNWLIYEAARVTDIPPLVDSFLYNLFVSNFHERAGANSPERPSMEVAQANLPFALYLRALKDP